VNGNGSCPFCAKFEEGINPDWPCSDTILIAPLNPVVPGHMMVIPRTHVEHFGVDPLVSALVMGRVAQFIQGYAADGAAFNVITNVGEAASQTVKHLHVHIIPRLPGDGIKLPWTGQNKEQTDAST
jgi:histidine triad (HIT) family protein